MAITVAIRFCSRSTVLRGGYPFRSGDSGFAGFPAPWAEAAAAHAASGRRPSSRFPTTPRSLAADPLRARTGRPKDVLDGACNSPPALCRPDPHWTAASKHAIEERKFASALSSEVEIAPAEDLPRPVPALEYAHGPQEPTNQIAGANRNQLNFFFIGSAFGLCDRV